jgi:dolichyl-phosphate-mannose-protein mannosyltransferase
MARSSSARGKSPQPPAVTSNKSKKNTSYKSDGVENNDVFLLPVSDYVVSFFLTILAAVVRVFRIYQPSSVVFDEVQ